MNIEDLKIKLKEEGFVHIFEWNDKPGEIYEPHSHKDKVSMYILDGGLVMQIGDEEVVLKKGDRYNVPVGKEHTAEVGPEGCHYLVGEMIEGDS